jgi:hypothetical protein
MGVFNGLFPILPGKEDAARILAKELLGPRRKEYDAFQARSDFTRETWALQPTPAGLFMNVWFEGDVEHGFADLATAQDDFTVWFRAQLLDITGVDLSAPVDAPPPEMVFDWKA